MSSYNFIDEINRLFDELVVEPWKPQRRQLAGHRPGPEETEFEVSVPVDEASAQEVSVVAEGGQLVVTVRRNHARREVVGEAEVSSGVEEHFRRSFALPAGTVLRSVQTRFEKQSLRVRICISPRA